MIFVAGSANLDFVVRASHIPVPGETVLGRELLTFPGGKGANQALGCARAGGVATEMLLALGDDAHAAPIEASLRSAGVRLHIVRPVGHATGTAFICVSDDAQNAITVAPGANACLSPSHLPSLAAASHLMLQLEIPLNTVTEYARQARTHGVKVILNAAPAQALGSELLSLIDILIVNENELNTLSGKQGTIAQKMVALALPGTITTLGEMGCVGYWMGRWYTQPGFAVNAVDTTAAGDTFCGMLAAALALQTELSDALRQACAAAALACTRPGAQQSIPTRAEVMAFLESGSTADAVRHTALRNYCDISD